MLNNYNRDDLDYAVKKLEEAFPKCFFFDADKRLPLKKDIINDLEQHAADVDIPRELMRVAVPFYENHWRYQNALVEGRKRLDLDGKEVATVTKLEQHNAVARIQAQRHKREEQKRLAVNAPVETKRPKPVLESNSSISKLPMQMLMPANKGTMPMPKATKPNDPLVPIENLLTEVRRAYQQDTVALRKPYTIAGLRVLVGAIEACIDFMERGDG